ncbi:MAG TPA: Sua5 YciO YrdC YwlC family protein [Epsilonproteobacteria bacterium]|nr:Sua5 YciO YrdC YwlC family protein [Campylobacterota bacterium]
MANLVFLTPTDTTVGFVSQNAFKLTLIKQRPPSKHYIKAIPSLRTLTSFTRVPNRHKKRIRRAKRSTFIFPNGYSYRVIKTHPHHSLIQKLSWAYTTSANPSGKDFDEKFATSVADVIVGYPLPEKQKTASSIYQINNTNIKRIR